MNLSPDWISAAAQPIATTVIAIATYGTFALVFALLVERFWKTASSADRHGLWLLALLAGTLGPILTQVVIPPVPPKDTLPEWVTVRYDLRKNVVAQATPASTPLPSAVTSAIPPSLNPTLSHSLQSPVPHSTITLTSDSARILASIASTGSLVLFIRMFLGSWLLHRLGRRSKPLGDEDWQQLLDRLQKQLGIRRTINLRIHPSETIPLTWGHRRPVVLLPQSAAQWSDERREAVLLHELAHIRRWDCATHGLAAFLQAIAWFHPIAWIALRRLNLEREQAWDDWGVNSGTKPAL